MTLFTRLYANAFLDGLVVTLSKPIVVQLPDASTKFIGVVAIDLNSKTSAFLTNSVLVRANPSFSH